MTKLQKKPTSKITAKINNYEEDVFYYNSRSDEEEALEVLGYNQLNDFVEEDRIEKFW